MGESECMEEAEPLLLTGRSSGEATFDISVARARGVRTIRMRSCDCGRRVAGQGRCCKGVCGGCGVGLPEPSLASVLVEFELARPRWIYEAACNIYGNAIEV